MIKKMIPYTVDIGAARPTIIRDVFGRLAINIEIGIRTQNAAVIPCIITGILLPHPLKYPILLNKIQVKRQSTENPFR